MKATSYTFDVAAVYGWESVSEARAKYGQAFVDAHCRPVMRAGRGADDWDKGYAAGAVAADKGLPCPTAAS